MPAMTVFGMVSGGQISGVHNAALSRAATSNGRVHVGV